MALISEAILICALALPAGVYSFPEVQHTDLIISIIDCIRTNRPGWEIIFIKGDADLTKKGYERLPFRYMRYHIFAIKRSA